MVYCKHLYLEDKCMQHAHKDNFSDSYGSCEKLLFGDSGVSSENNATYAVLFHKTCCILNYIFERLEG